MATSNPERGPGLLMLPSQDARPANRPCTTSSGRASPPASPRGFFTPALFVAKLDNLIQHLRIERDFELLGHSWGLTLAVEYIAVHRSHGLKHLVRTNGSASYPLWRAAVADLRSQWPKHALDFEVWPAEATKLLTQMGEDPTVYRATYVLAVPGLGPGSFPRRISWAYPCASSHRLGVNELVMTGVLKDWSVSPKLGKVSCPTLIISGADDAVQDSCVAPLFYGIEKAKWVTLGSSSHMAFWE
ncbi:Alpha/Beta hydrolase protein [Lactarius akahatsu]|uniref:Alpha/Beta hydrolase protein n=1 Tax=Lactarius akahatsu TaxID=416441 RepID=A0AAD4LBH5_9AGAM|nr:Alpha/Beta hydrolase protein [Lactarius akahatsu]